MELKEFAKMLNGKEYEYPQFTKEELQIAKDNGFVIVRGASDDLVELEGAITDEGDCFDGGRLYVKAIPGGGFVHNCERSNVFSFEARWCMDKDENGNIISWTYDTSIAHENFMIYEDGEPYCRGFVFKVVDKEEKNKDFLENILKRTRKYEPPMHTWFENTIHKRPLYSGGAYALTVRTFCESNSVEYAVYNPLGNTRRFTDFTEAKKYYFSLGN